MAIQRLNKPLPPGFDPDVHQDALLLLVANDHGKGWELDSCDPDEGIATFSRQTALTQVRSRGAKKAKNTKDIDLPRTVTPGDGDKMAAKYEDQFPGFYLTRFEPFLGKATLTRLSDEEANCRGAVALALGVKPWGVDVQASADGGFDVKLPKTYVPSRHYSKLEEVATELVGQAGWYVTVDTKTFTARIVPSNPPTFPPMISYPLGIRAFDTEASWRIPIGEALGSSGSDGQTLELDFDATPGALVVGTAGSGKTVTINAIIAGALARGFELAIGDVPHKAIDFTWCKNFVRPGGWGCESPAATLTMLKLVYEEKDRRSALLAEHGVQKLQDLPASVRPRPILVVLDEVTGMFGLEEVPKGIPKTHTLVREALAKNLIVQMIKSTVAKIPAELRFVGIRIIVATQMAQANTGITVPLKTNLANRILLGANPNDQARGHAFLDPRSVPTVPENVKADRGASRGVGSAEFEGQVPTVFKSYFASTGDYTRFLTELGAPQTSQPEPTSAQIAKHTPSLDEDGFDDDDAPGSRLSQEGGFGQADGRDDRGPRLMGAAAASHALAVEAQAAKRRAAKEAMATFDDD